MPSGPRPNARNGSSGHTPTASMNFIRNPCTHRGTSLVVASAPAVPPLRLQPQRPNGCGDTGQYHQCRRSTGYPSTSQCHGQPRASSPIGNSARVDQPSPPHRTATRRCVTGDEHACTDDGAEEIDPEEGANEDGGRRWVHGPPPRGTESSGGGGRFGYDRPSELRLEGGPPNFSYYGHDDDGDVEYDTSRDPYIGGSPTSSCGVTTESPIDGRYQYVRDPHRTMAASSVSTLTPVRRPSKRCSLPMNRALCLLTLFGITTMAFTSASIVFLSRGAVDPSGGGGAQGRRREGRAMRSEVTSHLDDARLLILATRRPSVQNDPHEPVDWSDVATRHPQWKDTRTRAHDANDPQTAGDIVHLSQLHFRVADTLFTVQPILEDVIRLMDVLYPPPHQKGDSQSNIESVHKYAPSSAPNTPS
jgi:hypothetical protein